MKKDTILHFSCSKRKNRKVFLLRIILGIIFLFSGFSLSAETVSGTDLYSLTQTTERIITGNVSDSEGNPLVGVTVLVKGTNEWATTDFDGNYTLNATSENPVLVFSMMGFIGQEIPATSKDIIDVVMQEDVTSLDEVVLIGYGQQKKATITGAISTVQSEKLVQAPVANVSNAVVGRVSGILATQSSGAPGQDQSTLRIRGIGTFTGGGDPLIMVDGIQVQNYNNIDPNEIESISVLKDASATAVYGVRGANGVLLITTKRGKKGAPVISYTSQAAVSKFANIREYASSADYARGYNEALRYDSYLTGAYLPKYSEEDIQHYASGDDPLFYPDTDWIDLMFKKQAFQIQHNLNISGGTDRVKYFVSVGYLGQNSLYNDKVYDPGYDATNRFFNDYRPPTDFHRQISGHARHTKKNGTG